MTRLVRVELRRMLSRRMIQLALLAMVAVVALSLYGLHSQLGSLADDRAMIEQSFEQAQRDWELHGEEYVASCLEEQEREREITGDETIDYGCDQMREPRLEDFAFGPQSLYQAYEEFLSTLTYPVLFLALAMGATAVAAEYAHRTMGTWLTFEPRRDRVLGSKLVAAALGTLPLSLGFVTLVLLGSAAVFRIAGIDDSVTGEEWGVLFWMALRVVALIAACGLAGAAGGALLRHTGAVLGVVIGYLVVVEGVLVNLFTGLARWVLSLNLDAWLRGGAQRTTFDCRPDGACTERVLEISQARGGIVLAVVILAVTALAWWRFRRSDVD